MCKIKKMITIYLIIILTTLPTMSLMASDIQEVKEKETKTVQENQETESVNNDKKNQIIDYVYVENPIVNQGGCQNIVVSLLDKNIQIETAQLLYYKEGTSEILSCDASDIKGSIVLFDKGFNQDIGNYILTGINYVEEGIEKNIEFLNEGIETSYIIKGKEEMYPSENEKTEVAVSVIDQSGEMKEVPTLEEGLNIAKQIDDGKNVTGSKTRSNNGNIVIVLDPGHDSTHQGACNEITGIREAEYTLRIAQACRNELMQYNGVEVYLTTNEDGQCKFGGSAIDYQICNMKRVEYAKSVNADIFISIHLNTTAASLTTANGAEVYVSNYSKYTASSTDLANRIINELGKLGISSRGVKIDANDQDHGKYDDGNWQDDFSVIKNSVLNGFPGMIVEHAFINNEHDAQLLKTRTTEFGLADARAIVNYYNLNKGAFYYTPRDEGVVGNDVTLTVNPQLITAGYSEYRFTYYDGNKWTNIGDFSTDTTKNWSPSAAGEYILGVEARNSSGDIKQYILWTWYTVKNPVINIKGIVMNEQENGLKYDLNCDIETNSTSLKYRFLEYDVELQRWSEIVGYSPNKTAMWEPKKSGEYWINVQVINSSGQIIEHIRTLTIDKGNAFITDFKANKTSPQIVNRDIELTASVKMLSDDKATTQFMVYDGKVWKNISKMGEDKAIWKPTTEGKYLLCFQVTSSTGKIFKQHMEYSICNPQVTINGINVLTIDNFNSLKLQANVNTNDDQLQYTFKVYDGKAWDTVQKKSMNNQVIWSPKSTGTFLLYVEVEDSIGGIHTYWSEYKLDDKVDVISFDAALKSPQKVETNIELTAITSPIFDTGAKYEFLAYDGKNWSEISRSNKLEKVIWKPSKANNYLLCFQVILSNGKVIQKFLDYTISAPYIQIQDIQIGNMDNNEKINLKTIISTNDNKIEYTYKVYDGIRWSTLGEKLTSSEIQWKPKASGVYKIYVEIKDSANKVYTFWKDYEVKNQISIDQFEANLKTPQNIGTEITLSASVSKSFNEEMKYNFLVYDGKNWTNLDVSEQLGNIIWKPSKEGHYLVCFQVLRPNLPAVQSFISYDISKPFVQIQDIQIENMDSTGNIQLKAVVGTNESKLNYLYKIYDGFTWKTVGESMNADGVQWKPQTSGTYLIYVETKDSANITHTFWKTFELKNNIQITSFTSNLCTPQKVGSKIQLLAKIKKDFDEKITYNYLVYDGKNWNNISISDKLDSVFWEPSVEGDYLVCFQVIRPNQPTVQSFMEYKITKPFTQLNGINISGLNSAGEVHLDADIITTENDLTYTYKVYEGGKWKIIDNPQNKRNIIWIPKNEGEYLLALEVKDSKNNLQKVCIPYMLQYNIRINNFSTDKESPQKKEQPIQLIGNIESNTKNVNYQYLSYDGNAWSLLYSDKTLKNIVWTPKKAGNYWLCLQVITDSGRVIQNIITYEITSFYNIMGDSPYSLHQSMIQLYSSNGGAYPSEVMGRGGAPNINDFCNMYLSEAMAEGVNAEVAFCQSMLETGFLTFKGDVKMDQYNFAGLGAIGNGAPGNRFPDVRTGIRAHIQHLKCYASTAPLNQPCVDPRWNNYLRGKAPYVEWLSIPNNPYGTGWASDPGYAGKIQKLISKMS